VNPEIDRTKGAWYQLWMKKCWIEEAASLVDFQVLSILGDGENNNARKMEKLSWQLLYAYHLIDEIPNNQETFVNGLLELLIG
jgi:hypothetical protein